MFIIYLLVQHPVWENQQLKGLPAWQLPCCLWQMISHRRPVAMFPATDDNGMLHPYFPVSCYRCAFPSCRSPLGASSCLRLLVAPPLLPLVVALRASQAILGLQVSFYHSRPSAPQAGFGTNLQLSHIVGKHCHCKAFAHESPIPVFFFFLPLISPKSLS